MAMHHAPCEQITNHRKSTINITFVVMSLKELVFAHRNISFASNEHLLFAPITQNHGRRNRERSNLSADSTTPEGL
jgi:hypothetical protein